MKLDQLRAKGDPGLHLPLPLSEREFQPHSSGQEHTGPKRGLRRGRETSPPKSPGAETGRRGAGPVCPRTCMSTLSRSRGAVQVLDTAPAPPPATRCLHHIPVCLSSTVNSSGTVRFSPTSKICEEDQPGSDKQALAPVAKLAADSEAHNVPLSRTAAPRGATQVVGMPRTVGSTPTPPATPLPPPPYSAGSKALFPACGLGEAQARNVTAQLEGGSHKGPRTACRSRQGAPARTACAGISAEGRQAGCTETIWPGVKPSRSPLCNQTVLAEHYVTPQLRIALSSEWQPARSDRASSAPAWGCRPDPRVSGPHTFTWRSFQVSPEGEALAWELQEMEQEDPSAPLPCCS